METPSLLFLLVNYYNDDEVINFIRQQLMNQSVQNWEVIVTDNGSNDHDLLKKKLSVFENVFYVDAGSNTGYFNGAACGLDFYLTLYPSLPEWIIVCNSDLEFESKNFLERLSCLPREYDILGPRIRSAQSKFDLNPISRTRFPKIRLRFLYYLFSIYPLYLFYQILSLVKKRFFKKNNYRNDSPLKTVYAIHGSYMVFRKTFFQAGGKLKYESFLYEEELYVAEQARILGLKTIYEPTISLIHHQHSTTGTIKSIQQIRYMRKSIRFILKKFYNE